MKILLVTDIHYGFDKRGKIQGTERITLFGGQVKESLRSLKSIAQECDLVMNLGDIIEQISLEEDKIHYKEAIHLLDFGVPLHHVVGNHDMIFLNRSDVGEMIGELPVYYSFDLGGYHHVVLDGNRDGKTRPEPFRFDIPQIEWLKEDLQKTSLSTIVYSHYPIDEYDLQDNPIFTFLGKDMAFPVNADLVKDVLENSNKVIAVLSGHMHFSHHQITKDITHYTAGSFSINNGFEKPSSEYTIVTLNGRDVSVEKNNL